MMRLILSATVVLACAAPVVAQSLLPRQQTLMPWQRWVDKPAPSEVKSLESLFDLGWRDSGADSGKISLSDEAGPGGGKVARFHVKVSHHHPGPYPAAWPSFELRPDPNLDFRGFTGLRYWIRCDTACAGSLPLRFILWTGGEGRVNQVIPGVKRGEWVQVTQQLGDIPALDRVDRIHFFLCESDFAEGTELDFRVGGFELVRFDKELTRPAPEEAALALWLGDRGDATERIVMLEPGAAEVPALLVAETGPNLTLRPDDALAVKFHEVFSGQETMRSQPLGQAAPARQVSRITARLDTSGLEPGYYLVVIDLRRQGRSLLAGAVGSWDLYLRKAGESMTTSVLSIRTGMVLWLRDLLYGDIMGWAKPSLPHTYDPLNTDTYPDFLRAFAGTTGKHTEGNEAGDTGLALAAEAFRKSGDMTRCRFTEWLMEDSFRHMIERMQAPSGGCIMYTDELGDAGLGDGGKSNAFGWYDNNQIGEWMRALTYGIIYYSRVPEKKDVAKWLSAACRKSADYVVRNSLMDSDGIPGVLRHLQLSESADGKVSRAVYHQEGRQCDVYLGRALSGLSYYAYAMQLLGEKVPDNWWPVMDNTVKWCQWKMKPNGWFDWQCGDVVEGGCHTFLGNMYIAEGLFGIYLASQKSGRAEGARAAAEAARKAYRYVTDDCWIKGHKFEVDGAAEFWVGPYLYWLLAEYLDTVGPEDHLADWLHRLDRLWSEEHAWRDFLDRPLDGTGYVGRASENGMLNVAVLGYLGIKQMAEAGKPLHWETK